MLQRYLAAAVIAAAVVGRPLPALAQPAPPQDPSAAAIQRKHRYKKASQAVKAQNLEEARTILVNLWQTRPSHDVASLLGYVEYHLENYTEAAGYITYAIENFPPSVTAESLESLEEDLQAARAHIGTVKVGLDAPSAELLVDGTPQGNLPRDIPLFLDPGTHRIEARAGEQHDSQELTVRPGKTYRVDLQLGSPQGITRAATDPPASSPSPTHSAPLRDTTTADKPEWPYWVAGTVATVGLGLGVGFTIAAASEEDAVRNIRRDLNDSGGRNHCSSDRFSVTCSRLTNAVDDHNRHTAIATAGYITLGIGAAGLLSYWLVPESAFAQTGLSISPRHAVVTWGDRF